MVLQVRTYYESDYYLTVTILHSVLDITIIISYQGGEAPVIMLCIYTFDHGQNTNQGSIGNSGAVLVLHICIMA